MRNIFIIENLVISTKPKRPYNSYRSHLITVLSLLSIPCSQLPKTLATDLGGYKLDAIWMADHIERAKLHSKNKCFIVSSCGQNIHFVLPCQFRLTRLSFVRMTPLRRYHVNTLILSGIFICHIFLLSSTGTSECTKALYMESTENLPFSHRFQRNSSGPCVS